MGLFVSQQEKWVKKHIDTPWNRMFTGFEQVDAMITKLMVYKCVSFADRLLASDLFSTENLAIRIETILLAKMHFYHVATKSATVHNLFYGYIYELWINHYHEDVETANLALGKMHDLEKWYLTWYYDFYDDNNGSFIHVIKHYCENTKNIKTSDGSAVLTCESEDLHQYAAKLLMDMHIGFMAEMK